MNEDLREKLTLLAKNNPAIRGELLPLIMSPEALEAQRKAHNEFFFGKGGFEKVKALLLRNKVKDDG